MDERQLYSTTKIRSKQGYDYLKKLRDTPGVGQTDWNQHRPGNLSQPRVRDSGTLTTLKDPESIFAKQREHLRSVKNAERVRARVTEEVPKLTDPDIIERIEKYKGRNREDVEKGQ